MVSLLRTLPISSKTHWNGGGGAALWDALGTLLPALVFTSAAP